jgi:hypothetical protein
LVSVHKKNATMKGILDIIIFYYTRYNIACFYDKERFKMVLILKNTRLYIRQFCKKGFFGRKKICRYGTFFCGLCLIESANVFKFFTAMRS